MSKYSPFNIALSFLLLLLLSASNPAKLQWKENIRLQTAHYKGKPVVNSKFYANTSTQLSFTIIRKTGVTAEATAFFDPYKSWIRPTSPVTVIQHEQLHFDITEIYAREMRKQIKVLEGLKLKPEEHKVKLTNLYNTVAHLLRNDQMRYDVETNHSLDKAMQKKWTDSVAIRLSLLKAYSK